jgi:hypothetical protein
MNAEGAYSAYELAADDDHNIVMNQIERAVRTLTPAENKRFFGFKPKQRAYVCPICWGRANRDWQEDWPALAQLSSKSRGDTRLHCIVCDETTEVERLDCINPDCTGTVIHEETCLTCLSSQDSPCSFPSGLQNDKLPSDHEYYFSYTQHGRTEGDHGRFPNHTAAIEHARRAMEAPYLQVWRTVSVSPGSFGLERKVIGTWFREPEGLVWRPGLEPSFLESNPSGETQS